MYKIYEAHQLMKLYELAMQGQQRTLHDLYDEMALQFAYEFKKLYDVSAPTVHVFAGYGINGACALAVARLLGEYHYKVRAYLFYRQGTLEPACQYQRDRLQECADRVALVEVSREFRMPTFGRGEVIIDGLFGSELMQPLEAGFVALIKKLNASALPIVSIDMPSGIYAQYNTSTQHEQAVRATHTITFGTPRLAMLLEENSQNMGQWRVLPLNIGDEVHHRLESRYHLIEGDSLAQWVRSRGRFATKESCGAVLLIGGATTRYGRLVLAATAAQRAGCGRVVAHTPRGIQGLLPLSMPELDVTEQEIGELPHGLQHYQAVGLGTGLQAGLLDATYLYELFTSYGRPIVLDDEVIDMLCLDGGLLTALPRGSVLLCSRAGQYNLFGQREHSLDLIEEAVVLAERYSITLVLKGAYTAVCTASGAVYFNATSSPALATSGCGDVLMGLILGLMAGGYSPERACLVACYLHGRASELYVARFAPESMLASDLLPYIGKAMREL